MKFKFTSKSKKQAEKFQKYIKADRNLDSTITEKDGKFYVEYTVAEVALAAKKYAAKKAKKTAKPDAKDAPMDKTAKADMGLTPESCSDEDCYVEYDDMMDCMSQLANYLYNEMQYQLNWIWAEVDYIENAFYNHVSNGHLPPINGAEKMQNALDALGVGGDYQVQKPIVYASTRHGTSMEIDISAKK